MSVLYQTTNANTPALSSSPTALVSNPARIAWGVQNCGTNPLFVMMGTSATTTIFHRVLTGGTVASSGSGATLMQNEGVVYTGIVTVAGTFPLYVVTELAP